MEIYSIDICGSLQGCPRAIGDCQQLAQLLDKVFRDLDFGTERLRQLGGKFKQHHVFKVAIAGCANSCSQPQIKDFAFIAKSLPQINRDKCTACGLCYQSCREKGMELEGNSLSLVEGNCLGCGDCIHVCPQGALTLGKPVWRLLMGGKLGRHPQLAQEIGEVDNEKGAEILKEALNLVLSAPYPQLRFGDLMKAHKFII